MRSWKEEEGLGRSDKYARGAIVAMAALVEARRKAPSLPSVRSIADEARRRGVRTALLGASERATREFGVPLPGIGSVWSRSMTDEALAELAERIAEFDWEGVEDPAGRALQECRAALDRKRNGAFYTPGEVVAGLLDAVERGRTLLGARVLDPACGSGAFLLAAAQRGAIVSGADVDAEAVDVARFRLRVANVPLDGKLLATNLLAARPSYGAEALDPLDLPGPFDAVIGNPPYVRFQHLDEHDRRQLSLVFETATGQFDLFAPFLEASLARVRDGGRVGFVLPALVLRGARYRDLRRFLLSRAHIREVIDHGDGAFEGVLAPTCSLVMERTAAVPRTATRGRAVVRWSRAAREGRVETVSVDERRWRADDEAAFAPVEEGAAKILDRLSKLPRLETVATLGRGVELGRRHPALHSEERAGRIACVTGSDVGRHSIHSRRWLELAALPLGERPSREELVERVLVRETGERLTALRAPAGLASTRSLFHVIPRDARRTPTAFLSAWIGSAIAQWWFATMVRAESAIFPKVRIGQLSQLPIPDDRELIETLVPLLEKRERAKTSRAILIAEAEIDGAIHAALGFSAADVGRIERGR